MKLKTFAGRAAAAGAVLAALVLAALPVWAAPRVQVDKKNAVADHADILSAETENYINEISISLSDACGAQIGVYTVDELLGNTTMEGFAYNVFNDWELGSADQNNGVLLLLAPYEADGGDYYIMRGTGLESRLSFSTLGSLLDEYMEPYWATGDYDTGTQKTVQALADRLCSIYGVTLDSGYTANTAARGGVNVMGMILLIIAVILIIWITTVVLRPRGPRPPRRGGRGGSIGSNMFWYGMGRASRRQNHQAFAECAKPLRLSRRRRVRSRPRPGRPASRRAKTLRWAASFGRVPRRRRLYQRRRCRPQPSLRRVWQFASLGRWVPLGRRLYTRRRCGAAPLKANAAYRTISDKRRRYLCLSLQLSPVPARASAPNLRGSCLPGGIT